MAVISTCPGIEVEIVVDDSPLEEYDDDDVGDLPSNTLSKYIEAISRAKFEVRYTFTRSFIKLLRTGQGIKVAILVDGAEANNAIMGKDEISASRDYYFTGAWSYENGRHFQSQFCFRDIQIGMYGHLNH